MELHGDGRPPAWCGPLPVSPVSSLTPLRQNVTTHFPTVVFPLSFFSSFLFVIPVLYQVLTSLLHCDLLTSQLLGCVCHNWITLGWHTNLLWDSRERPRCRRHILIKDVSGRSGIFLALSLILCWKAYSFQLFRQWGFESSHHGTWLAGTHKEHVLLVRGDWLA